MSLYYMNIYKINNGYEMELYIDCYYYQSILLLLLFKKMENYSRLDKALL